MKKALITWSTILVKGTQKCNFSPRLMLTSAIYHFLPRVWCLVIYILKNNSYSFLIRKAFHVFVIQFGKYKNYEEENENHLLSWHPEKSFITFHAYVCIFCKTQLCCMGAKNLPAGGVGGGRAGWQPGVLGMVTSQRASARSNGAGYPFSRWFLLSSGCALGCCQISRILGRTKDI